MKLLQSEKTISCHIFILTRTEVYEVASTVMCMCSLGVRTPTTRKKVYLSVPCRSFPFFQKMTENLSRSKEKLVNQLRKNIALVYLAYEFDNRICWQTVFCLFKLSFMSRDKKLPNVPIRTLNFDTETHPLLPLTLNANTIRNYIFSFSKTFWN